MHHLVQCFLQKHFRVSFPRHFSFLRLSIADEAELFEDAGRAFVASTRKFSKVSVILLDGRKRPWGRAGYQGCWQSSLVPLKRFRLLLEQGLRQDLKHITCSVTSIRSLNCKLPVILIHKLVSIQIRSKRVFWICFSEVGSAMKHIRIRGCVYYAEPQFEAAFGWYAKEWQILIRARNLI